MEAHLDLVGGLAGDMFIAAVLDAFPEHEHRVKDAIGSMDASRSIACRLLPHADDVLHGRRFSVELGTWQERAKTPIPYTASFEARVHAHVTWREIRSRLEHASLPDATRTHAIGIFQLLADAEAFVHGVEAENVSFHEVGAWDSVADIVGAAALLDALAVARWTASPAPLGGGQVRTAHGALPVPAPATTRLLMGMRTIDDGIPGERVTPTGAAILRYLCPPVPIRNIDRGSSVRTLVASGNGFGTIRLPGLSNHVRLLCFEPLKEAEATERRLIDILEFEIDDQSGEDLAAGLERVRGNRDVLDLTLTAAIGKKARMTSHVRVLVRHGGVESVIDACFRETTTIGLRHHTVRGIGLKRRSREVDIDGERLRVKIVDRPGGMTAKTESDDVLRHDQHAVRASLRKRAEQAVLAERDLEVDA